MRRREQKPMDHQRQAVRTELHAIVDRIVDDWEWIDSLSGSVRASGGGDAMRTGKGGHADPTGDAAAAGDLASDWLDRFRAFRVEARLIDAARAKLEPAKAKDRKRGRENTVDVCVRCNLPAPKVHRIDNQPYCATSCYYAEHRERKRRQEEARAS